MLIPLTAKSPPPFSTAENQGDVANMKPFDTGIIEELYREIEIPEFKLCRQRKSMEGIADVGAAIKRELGEKLPPGLVRPGMSVAIAVGSRGVSNIALVVRLIISCLKEVGAVPYIVPAMGSHGGATAGGQRHVLSEYGITEESMGVPVKASMEVIRLGDIDANVPAYVSSEAFNADGIVLVNRIKPHTDFRGEYESGLMKLMAIGLGKHRGALACHSRGWQLMPDSIGRSARLLLDTGKVLFGVGLVENEEHETCYLEAIPPEKIPVREREILKLARKTIGKIPFDNIDVLMLSFCGKEISGGGIDPNIAGRFTPGFGVDIPGGRFLVCSDLTNFSNGNAIGMGLADIITQRLYDKIDLTPTYINAITSRGLHGARIPLIVPTDLDAIRLCMLMCGKTAEDIRMVCMRDTLSTGRLYLSPALLHEAEGMSFLEPTEEVLPIQDGYLSYLNKSDECSLE